jgi:hypothetical protein
VLVKEKVIKRLAVSACCFFIRLGYRQGQN